MSDLRDAQAKGFISKLPHFNSIFNYLESPELTPILRDMITETSLPLKAVEVDFAADSSGFATSRFIRWFDHKYGTVRQQHEWVKVHLMCGVRTNIVTAVEIRDKAASDTKLLPDLVEQRPRISTSVRFRPTKATAASRTIKRSSAMVRRRTSPLRASILGAPKVYGSACTTSISSTAPSS